MDWPWIFAFACEWLDWHFEWGSFDDHSAYWLVVGPLHFSFICLAPLEAARPLTWQEAREAIVGWLTGRRSIDWKCHHTL